MGVLALAFAATAAAQAGATVQIDQFTDPASDQTAFTYTVQTPDGRPPSVVQLRHGQRVNYGPFAGTVVAQAAVPPGWVVADIKCVGPNPAAFAIDIPNARVTVQHAIADEQFCAFTMRTAAAQAAAGGRTEGFAPTISPNDRPKVSLPARAALLGLYTRRGGSGVTLRLARRSAIRLSLLRGKRVVGTRRIVLGAGTHDVAIDVGRKYRRQLRRRGVKRVTLTVRAVVVPRSGGATQRFAARVSVRV